MKSLTSASATNGTETLAAANALTSYVYNSFFAGVRQTCKENNWPLFEFRVSDGWEPLCKYLGLPVPKGPFPHIDVHNGVCDPYAVARYVSLRQQGLAQMLNASS